MGKTYKADMTCLTGEVRDTNLTWSEFTWAGIHGKLLANELLAALAAELEFYSLHSCTAI